MPGTQYDFTQGVSFSRDGRTLIAARATGIIQLWDIAERRRIAMLRAESDTTCTAFSRDGRYVASGGTDAMVRVWDLTPALTPGRGEESETRVPNP
jgi:WD40 repeat protein